MGKIVKGRFTGNNQYQKEEPQYQYDEILKCISIQLGETVPKNENTEKIDERDSKTDIFIFVMKTAVIFATFILPIAGVLKR